MENNEHLHYEKRWIWERFPKPSDFKSLNFKTFVKGNLKGVKFKGPHQPWFDGPEKDYYRACNSLGEPTVLNNNGKYKRRNIKEVSYDGAVIMHY